MSPEYGATCTMFPIDQVTIDYMRFTGRDEDHLALVEAYAKEQGLWHTADGVEPVYSEYATLDLGDVEPSLAGPSRPQDRVALAGAGDAFRVALDRTPRTSTEPPQAAPHHLLADGDVVVAAITSCTNTSNPQVMVGAGLLAKNAVARGLRAKPWVKTSLAPGSRVVMDYLERAQLVGPLEQLGFFLVGFGCTTCIGNSGPLLAGVSELVHSDDLSVVSVLSGNRNFEGRIHPDVRMNYLASPPLVVAYALAGTMDIDLTVDPLGEDGDGKPVFLADIWPSEQRGQRGHPGVLDLGDVPHPLRRRVRGRRVLERGAGGRGRDVLLAGRLHLREEPALLRRHDHDADAGDRHRGGTRAGHGGRQRHHRPHLPGWLHRPRHTRRSLPGRARRAPRTTSTPTGPGGATTRS